jgi:hypothetical protein
MGTTDTTTKTGYRTASGRGSARTVLTANQTRDPLALAQTSTAAHFRWNSNPAPTNPITADTVRAQTMKRALSGSFNPGLKNVA